MIKTKLLILLNIEIYYLKKFLNLFKLLYLFKYDKVFFYKQKFNIIIIK